MYKAYKGKIVHVFGVLSSYLGEIDTQDHPNGKNWMRLHNPCIMENRLAEDKQTIHLKLIKLGGTEELYAKHVDIKIPSDMCIEIREINKKGPLFDLYHKEIKRKKSKLIYTPNDPRLTKVHSIGTH